MMKRILLIACCTISLIVHAQQQQKVNTFGLVDAMTRKPIPYTSVTILRAKLAIATEADGTFQIPGNLAAMRDTIIFNAQTYVPLKLPLYKLATMDTIPLSKIITKPKNTTGKFTAKLTLNNYVPNDVGLYAGIATDGASFNYLQIAQCFETKSINSRLASVSINKMTDWLPTKFRVRIYDIDEETGGPGSDLCDQIIDQDNNEYVSDYLNRRSTYSTYIEGKTATIDLRKYDIIIPNKSFFVAIEWLRDFFNASKAPVYNKITNKVDTAIVFRPYVGLSPITGHKLNIWVMELDSKWKTYDHFYPIGTDLAIMTTVEY